MILKIYIFNFNIILNKKNTLNCHLILNQPVMYRQTGVRDPNEIPVGRIRDFVLQNYNKKITIL